MCIEFWRRNEIEMSIKEIEKSVQTSSIGTAEGKKWSTFEREKQITAYGYYKNQSSCGIVAIVINSVALSLFAKAMFTVLSMTLISFTIYTMYCTLRENSIAWQFVKQVQLKVN